MNDHPMHRLAATGAALIALLCGAAAAQHDTTKAQDRGAAATSARPGYVKATTLIGHTVYNTRDEAIGTISDMIVTSEGGVHFAVLSHGGYLGIGDKLVAVPWSLIEHRTDAQGHVRCVAPVTKETLEAAPAFKADEWRMVRERSWLDRTARAFGAGPEPASARGWGRDSRLHRAFENGRRVKVEGEITALDHHRPAGGVTEALVATVKEDSGQTRRVILGPAWFMDLQSRPLAVGHRVEINAVETTDSSIDPPLLARDIEHDSHRVRLADDRGTPLWDAWTGDGSAGPEPSRPYIRAGTLLDAGVKDTAGEDAGTIENLAVRADAGRIDFAAVSHGGVLGVGGDVRAVPWDALSIDAEGKVTLARGGKDRLKTAPELTDSAWSRLDDPAFRQSIYAHFGLEAPRQDDDAGTMATGAMMTGWECDSPYNEKFKEGKKVSLTGTVVSMDRRAPDGSMSDAACLRLNTPEGERIVHVGPAWYIDRQGLSLRSGDSVTVEGVAIGEPGGADAYIMAREVRTPRGTLAVRDADGTPRWDCAGGK